ncbi:hypothetical protein ACSVH6_12745, partial [Flavobacterium sp. XGLA_31]
MKKKYYFYILLNILLISPVFSQNLLTNGDFESGISGVGFVTNGAGYTYVPPASYGTTTAGKFAVAPNPKLVNTTNFISEGDHTSGTGNMLLFDCGTTTSNSSFWKAGSTGAGVTGLTVGTTYYFSYWIKSISNQVTSAATSANIAFTAAPTGATAPVLLSGTALAPLPALGWRQVIYSFTATATTVTLDLKNTTSNATGNDFAVDDFMLTDDLTVTYTVTNANCAVGNNGSVTVTAFGGTLPYTTYTLTGPGPTNVSNATGVFTNLQPGTYTVSVTDSGLPTPQTATLTNVVVGPTITIVAGANGTTICSGGSTTLTASGSSAAYSWTSNPVGFTSNVANPTVSPTVTTIYTVSSTIGSCAPLTKSITVNVNSLPTATISGTTTICSGATTVITFTGTPNATVTYKVNGGTNQTIVLDAAGNATLTTPSISATTVYSLVNVISAAPASCTNVVSGSAVVTVNIQLGVTASPNPICANGISTVKAAGFTFGAAAGVPLNPMTGATTILTNGNDNTPSTTNNIGFSFEFAGITYTQFSVSPDGWLLLGGATASNQATNTTTSALNIPKLYPFWDDMTTGTDGSVSVLVTGTAPNRIFIVQWNVTIPKNLTGPANSTFQMWLYETTNVVEYHYGTMGAQTSNSISGGYTVSATNFSSINFANNSASSTIANDANTVVPASGTSFVYTPLTSLIWSPTTNLFIDSAATIPYTGDSRDLVYATNLPLAGATYTVTGTSAGGCTATANVTITVSVPTAAPSANQTICPGNAATITITGTPNSVVTIVNNATPQATYTVNIGPTGTGIFTTPVLQETVIYNLIKVKGFFSLCETTLTGVSVTITVVPNGCATVETVNAPNTPPLDLTLCTVGECRTLEANFSPIPSTNTYAVTSIPFCPQAAFENPSWTNIGPGTAFGDDDWSCPFTFPAGMNFCFYGQNYTQLNVGTNQVIHFPSPSTFACGDFCPWSYNSTIPNAGFPVTNAIFGVYQDTDYSVTPPAGTNVSVNYSVVGTYPCRKFIANFTNCPQFSCGNTLGFSTSQIVLYEVSNIIEVYVQRRVACTGWNGGRGTIGVINNTGTQAVAAPGRNAAPFSTDPTPTDPNNPDNVSEAWRFTPTGPNVPVVVSWYDGATLIGTGPTITVCPTTTTTYCLKATYDVCGVPQFAESCVTLNVNPDLTGQPNDLTECNSPYDLTENDTAILGALNPAEYEITYHTNPADADTGNNPIPNPTAYIPPSLPYTVYASIYLNSYNCRVVKPFDLLEQCGVTIQPVSDLTECETTYGSGVGSFNFTPQTPIALGPLNPLDYTVTYHLNQTDANNGVAINPIANVLGTEGQVIVVKLTDNNDSSISSTTTFTLHVNPLPTAAITGTTSICSGNNTQICFNGTPDATVTYTVDGGTNQTIVLDATGNACLTTPNLTATSVYTLVSVINTITNCSQNLTGSATVTVVPLPTATISGTTSVCVNSANPLITFEGFSGTPPYTFTYLDANGVSQTVSTTAGNSTVTVSAPTTAAGTFTYTLVNVQSSGTPSCSQNQNGTVTITVNPLPTATISGTVSVCKNSTPDPTITFTGANGTAPYTFTYLDANNVSQTITSVGNTATITVPTTVVGAFTYTLVSVQDSSTTVCSQTQSGSATVTVNDIPVINTPTPYVVCDDTINNDGIYCFDLTIKNPEISTAAVTITYHETQTDADTGANPKSSPYCNISTGTQTLYVRVFDPATPACYATTTLQLVVNP